MLKKLGHGDFDGIYKILDESFPIDEKRPYERQRELLDDPIYSVYGIIDGEKVKAVAAVYRFENALFLEHLAVSREYRNGGLGALMLSELCKLCSTVCLEVELPATEIAKRRIGFYERNGFYYNDYHYVQPALAEGQDPIELRIMTSGRALDEEEFIKLRDLIYEKAYKCRM